MSNTIPISKIAEYKHGDALTAVSGMLENVWERKTGKTKKGRPYSIQNLMLKDATGTIKVTLFGRKECPKSMEGKQVEFLGVLVDDNTYNGKTTRTVKVTEDSSVKALNDDNQQGPTPGRLISAPSPTASNSSEGTLVHGQTVGMSINNAVTILMSQGKGVEYYGDDQFIYDLHAIASSIIHVSRALEYGRQLDAPKIAPAVHNGPSDSHCEPPPDQPEPPDDSSFLKEGEEVF